MWLELWPREAGQGIDPDRGCVTTRLTEPSFRVGSLTGYTDPPRCVSASGAGHNGELHSLVDSAGLILTLIAETMLEQVPPADSESDQLMLPAKGRRLLIFSDSRRESARLGSVLTWQHEIQLVRALILDTIAHETAAPSALTDALENELSDVIARQADATDPSVRAYLQRRQQDLKAQLARSRAGGSIRDWAEQLKQQSAIGELIDWNAADSHDAATWTVSDFQTNRRHIQSQLPMLIGREFLAPGRTLPNLETLGLLSVIYPGLDGLAVPDSLSGILGPGIVTTLAEVWPSVISALLDSLRRSGVVTLGSYEDDEAYGIQRAPIGKFSIERGTADRRTEPFIGATERQQRRRFATTLLIEAGESASRAPDLAPRFLDDIFHQLVARAGGHGGHGWDWLETERHVDRDGRVSDGIRIKLTALAMRRADRLWMDKETGQIVSSAPRSLHPATGAVSLTPIAATTLDRDARFARRRSELSNSRALRMGLWAAEHSAQLAAPETRRLQALFERGVRNVLSSSTTMELGVDIGGLEAVMMSNVPPNNARYRQRAGRAGRRARGSAIAVTYTRNQPFDREVFSVFDKYLGRALPPPSVILHRRRIGERHLHAHLLGHFMRLALPGQRARGAMLAFGRMGQFDGQPAVQRWTSSALPRPAHREATPSELGDADAARLVWWDQATDKSLGTRFIDYLTWLRSQPTDPVGLDLKTIARETGVAEMLRDWPSLCDAVRTRFEAATKAWREEYTHYLKAWERADTTREANFVRYQANLLYETTVIEQLANEQFLPRYGFPIGLLALRVQSNDSQEIRTEDRFDLQRSGALALREYVPGSRVIVGGREAHSRGVLKHWTGEQLNTAIGERRALHTCGNEHRFSVPVPSTNPRCEFCGESATTSPEDLLMVRFGFSTAAWEPMARARSSEAIGESDLLPQLIREHYVPAPLAEAAVDDFAQVAGAQAELHEGARLIVTNRGENEAGFAVCLRCGYADSEKSPRGSGAMYLPSQFEMHSPLNAPRRGRHCWSDGDPQIARHQSLAAEESTDTLSVDFRLADPQLSKDKVTLTAIGLAARHAGAQLLLVDARELAVIPQPTGPRTWRLLFYDDVSGGAGHVSELLDLGRPWLEATIKRLFVSEEHHVRCSIGCLDCIVSYESQYQLPDQVDRRRAHDSLVALLNGTPLGKSSADSGEKAVGPSLVANSIAARREAARARRGKRGDQ